MRLQDEIKANLIVDPIAAQSLMGDAMEDGILQQLWQLSEAATFDVSQTEFADAMSTAGAKSNCGLAANEPSTPRQQTDFYQRLHLRELALAHGCALGKETAWQVFLAEYRSALTQAATGITGSSSLGEELAGSLYSDLYGLKERDGIRRSPFASYSGRGSLMGWLRAMLAQRHIDHHRRTHRESPLEDNDFAATTPAPTPPPPELSQLDRAVRNSIASLKPEDRFILASYFLDGRTLLELARLLRVHEATVSRRLRRLTEAIRKQLLKDLRSGGMSNAAAKEILGTDPRDLNINLRKLLQTSEPRTFSQQAGKT